MPRFDFECENCKLVEERLLPLSDACRDQFCRQCRWPMKKVFLRAPAGFVSNVYQPYRCPISGEVISGKRAHEENLAKHNCRLLESGEKEYNEKRRQADDAEFEKAIEETVEKEILAMPGEKREQLGKELESGVDATVERH